MKSLLGRWKAEDPETEQSLGVEEVVLEKICESSEAGIDVARLVPTSDKNTWDEVTVLITFEPDASWLMMSREVDAKDGRLYSVFGMLAHPFKGDKRDKSRLYGSFRYTGFRKDWSVRLKKITE